MGRDRAFCDPVTATSTFHSSIRKSRAPMELTPSTRNRAGCEWESIMLRTALRSLVTPAEAPAHHYYEAAAASVEAMLIQSRLCLLKTGEG